MLFPLAARDPAPFGGRRRESLVAFARRAAAFARNLRAKFLFEIVGRSDDVRACRSVNRCEVVFNHAHLQVA